MDDMEKRLADLGVNVYDLPSHINPEPEYGLYTDCRMVMRACRKYADEQGVQCGDIYPIVPFTLHLVDLLDRCETALSNAVNKLHQMGYNEECDGDGKAE